MNKIDFIVIEDKFIRKHIYLVCLGIIAVLVLPILVAMVKAS